MVNNFLLDGVRGVARTVPQTPPVPIPDVVTIEGIVSINGLTSQEQTITIDNSFTFPQINSVGSLHAISIPYASAINVTGGVVAHSDYIAWNTKEPGLGNPSSNGYVLSSTLSGTRSWIDPTTLTPSSVPWSHITSTPTTISGYGITDAYTKTQADARYLQSVMLTGDVTGSGTSNVVTTVTWVNGETTYDTRYVKLAGSTITGPILYASTPIGANELTNKSYVDNLVFGLSWKKSVVASTAAVLPSYTIDGTNTIITATSNGALTVDTITPSTGDRILVKNESGGINNGIYVITQGTGSTPYVLTRASDANTAALLQAATVYVRTGSVEMNRVYAVNSNPSSLASSITYVLIAGAGTYTNGIGIALTGNVFSIDTSYLASGAQTGYLSATNWTTFNNKVTSISGVSNRTIITGTTTIPIIDVSASYVGQATITTLGTIVTGVWQGTAIADGFISSASTWNAKQSAISLTNGSVMFYNSGVSQDNSNFYFSSHLLSVNTNGDQAGTDAINTYNQQDSFAPNSANTAGSATSAGHTVSTARGTTGSFTESTDGDYIGSFSYWPASGANTWIEGITLRGYVKGSTSTNRGTQFELWTKKDGGALTQAIVVDNLQNLKFGSTTANGLVANNLTTTQKNALSGIAGAVVYDTTQTRLSVFSAGSWVNYVRLSGDTMSGALNMNSNNVSNITNLILGTNLQLTENGVGSIGLKVGYNNNNSLSSGVFKHNLFTYTFNSGSEATLGFATGGTGGFAGVYSILNYSVPSSTGSLLAGQGFLSNVNISAGGGTVTVSNWAGYRVGLGVTGTSQLITTFDGYRMEDQTAAGITNVYGFRGLVLVGSNKYNIFCDGTAQNYLNGNFGIKIAVPQVELDVSGTIQATVNIKNVAAGGGFYVKEGSNATMGVASLSGGSATVATTKVTASSRIYLTVQSLGTIATPVPIAVTARSAGTSFTITSSAGVDTSTVAWIIFEPS